MGGTRWSSNSCLSATSARAWRFVLLLCPHHGTSIAMMRVDGVAGSAGASLPTSVCPELPASAHAAPTLSSRRFSRSAVKFVMNAEYLVEPLPGARQHGAHVIAGARVRQCLCMRVSVCVIVIMIVIVIVCVCACV